MRFLSKEPHPQPSQEQIDYASPGPGAPLECQLGALVVGMYLRWHSQNLKGNQGNEVLLDGLQIAGITELC